MDYFQRQSLIFAQETIIPFSGATLENPPDLRAMAASGNKGIVEEEISSNGTMLARDKGHKGFELHEELKCRLNE